MMTFGFVVARLGSWLDEIRATGRESETSLGTALGAAFVVLAVLVDLLAVARYRRAFRALLGGREVAPDRLPLLFGIVIIALGGGVIAYMVTALP
jgi:uncharacterized membrane protein YidH (DUF202 family)